MNRRIDLLEDKVRKLEEEIYLLRRQSEERNQSVKPTNYPLNQILPFAIPLAMTLSTLLGVNIQVTSDNGQPVYNDSIPSQQPE
jgi:hypothetical protein